jgi:hypothetical protein
MRETRLSGSEGGGTEFNRFSLPLSHSGPTLRPPAFTITFTWAAWTRIVPPSIKSAFWWNKVKVGTHCDCFWFRHYS